MHIIKNRIKRVSSAILKGYRFFSTIHRRFTYDHGGFLLAASISFYLVVSIIPLLLLVTTILTSVAHSSEAVYNSMLDFFETWIPSAVQPAVPLLNGLIQRRFSVGIISGLFLLWAASLSLDSTIQAIDRIWNVEERWPFWKRKLLSFLIIPILIAAFGVSIGFTGFISFMRSGNIRFMEQTIPGMSSLLGGLGILLSLLVITIFLFGFYKIVPHIFVSNRSAFIGATFAGCSWEIAKYLFDWYIARFTGFDKVYGSLGVVFVGLLWIYCTSIIILLGAEVAGYYEERRKVC